ncbi:CopG family transcriptional regulator [Trichocoleus sp. FACHB-262]|uniref:ribbon-helix-helix domain-containing protein n=1 Tax=Trichocoleus sp. FACHB-262 TaxID=2692869 RepID=UPI001689DDF5|nr:ribbon-helix-helix protein, CopG family [Trichocoleus sp. FACHB-262]MBD2124565.1 ribbon-helix-helix protein, CopG family [Trichocoleus sp. FACHB-262]
MTINPSLEGAARAPTHKRMSVSLPGDVAQLLESLAETQGISQNEALRKAIATEAYLLQERLQGSKVLLQKPDKEIREVIFR